MIQKPPQLFRMMLKSIISPSLKNYGFHIQNNSFFKTIGNNVGIVDFQKSNNKEIDKLSFTVNIGVVSYNLLKFINQEEEIRKLEIWDAQWNVRLGQLMPEKKDTWWAINESTNVEQLGRDLLDVIVNLALPEINKYISDGGLRDLWLSGKSPSLTDLQRLMYLSYFLKTIGPTELLGKTTQELERISFNKPTAVTAKVFLEKLEKL
jgi:hypothetical protein